MGNKRIITVDEELKTITIELMEEKYSQTYTNLVNLDTPLGDLIEWIEDDYQVKLNREKGEN
jgi:hypothetical protein